ncbi:MAG: four helix bundle protein [Desulfobacterales bacterium]|nr:four helix bundle protein [Desulfobacterales bacterium]
MEKPHKKLDLWKTSMELVKLVYRITSGFPELETYSLTNQIRRAAISIPSNIAEGTARQTKKELVNFLHIAQGSLSELDTQFDIALSLQYLTDTERKNVDDLTIRIDKMLTGLIRSKKA